MYAVAYDCTKVYIGFYLHRDIYEKKDRVNIHIYFNKVINDNIYKHVGPCIKFYVLFKIYESLYIYIYFFIYRQISDLIRSD